MFVKLAVLACSAAVAFAGQWHGPLAGGQPAALYPAGVSPQACPNFPHCDNPAVAIAGAHGGAGGWNGAGAGGGGWNGGHAGGWNGGNAGAWNGGHDNGQWNGGHDNGQWNGGNDNGQWNGGNHGNWNQNALDQGEYTGDGDYRGEGLAESGAYGGHDGGAGNNGAWNNGAGAGHAGAYGHGGAAQVPAGVDAHSCPNYPFCH